MKEHWEIIDRHLVHLCLSGHCLASFSKRDTCLFNISLMVLHLPGMTFSLLDPVSLSAASVLPKTSLQGDNKFL